MDRLSLLNPERLGTLAAQEAQGEVDTLDLTEPCLVFGAGAAGQQVVLDLVEPGKHFWVYGEHGASQIAWCRDAGDAEPVTVTGPLTQTGGEYRLHVRLLEA